MYSNTVNMSLFFRLVISVLAIFPTLSHAVSTSNSNFTLYAYGGDIGGLPIMYQGGLFSNLVQERSII